MDHRQIGELMTRDVISVRPWTLFKEIAKILADHDVSAVPVLDDQGRPAGVVSEADLLRKAAHQSDLTGRTPIPPLEDWERARAEGRTAEEVMSTPAVCAHPEWTVVEAARLMAVHDIKRLPVVDEADRLVGIVSRADLIRIFLRPDHAIRDEISRDIVRRTLGLDPMAVTADVHDGMVTLSGSVPDEGLVPVLVRLCSNVDGVVSVTERLGVRAGAETEDASPLAGREHRA
jgi:CBS domain-containing protein